MNKRTFILRSLVHHARSHLGTFLGAAVGTAILTGALIVGDSVRGSLKHLSLVRLGQVDFALPGNDRLFQDDLASRLETRVEGTAVAVLQLPGTVANSDGSARANQVQVLGVPETFWLLALQPPDQNPAALDEDAVFLNEHLAQQLQVKKGDGILLRFQKPSLLSRDAPLSPEEDSSVAWRTEVAGIVSDSAFGRFSLKASQLPPFNLYARRETLQAKAAVPGKANLLLVSGSRSSPEDPKAGPSLNLTTLQTALKETWQPADAELKLLALTNGMVELRSDRVFLDPPISQASLEVAPDAFGVLTYLVNSIRLEEQTTPYSMVTAAAPPLVPADLADDEVILNQWLAEDLQAGPGDVVHLEYYVVSNMRQTVVQSNRFTVHSILPMDAPTLDSSLMPDFPGLTDAENCRDWDTGFAIDMEAIRDKDEAYWDRYRGTPKALINLSAGQSMWANRFGNLTQIRYPDGDPEAIEAALWQRFDPEQVGFSFIPVRAQALAASAQSQDFGGLFVGFSFFLIAAALLLMSLLFQLTIEQRAAEVGTLLAVGYEPRHVRQLLLGEGVLVAVAGSLLGLGGAILYAQGMVYGLSTIWRNAVGTSALSYHAQPLTLLIGLVAGAAVAIVTIWLAVRKQFRQPARVLLNEKGEEEMAGAPLQRPGLLGRSLPWLMLIGAGACLAAGLSMKGPAAAGLFFGSGSLLLIAAMFGAGAALRLLAAVDRPDALTLSNMGLRNATRRRKRSLSAVALLACGSFLVASIGVFRLDATANADQRSSGTGGFAFIAQSSLPVVHKLSSEDGQFYFGLRQDLLEDVRFVQMRVREGEDASCLNLNRAQRPQLAGVDPEELGRRQAFTFTDTYLEPEGSPWNLLNQKLPGGAVPAIADAASIQWALGKKLGDTIDYQDERGRTFQVQLVGAVANSILQGNLLISEENFTAKFPNQSGYQLFLIDAPLDRADEVRTELSRGLRDVGLQLTPAPERLAAFNAVQNTYLSTFQILGGLGLILGSIGLGVIVLRNVLERKAEFGLLRSVGFRRRSLHWMIFAEHAGLLLAGLCLGVGCALVAVLPEILSPEREMPVVSLSLTLLGVLLVGAVWTWMAASVALKGELMKALRVDG